MIQQLTESYSVKTLCKAFGVHRSSYKYWAERHHTMDAEQIHLLSEVCAAHAESSRRKNDCRYCDNQRYIIESWHLKRDENPKVLCFILIGAAITPANVIDIYCAVILLNKA
jgi:hypothetical protein